MNLLSMEQNGGVVVIYYFVSSDLYEMATGRLSAITPSAVRCPHPLHMWGNPIIIVEESRKYDFVYGST